jgi:hypothetical protein
MADSDQDVAMDWDDQADFKQVGQISPQEAWVIQKHAQQERVERQEDDERRAANAQCAADDYGPMSPDEFQYCQSQGYHGYDKTAVVPFDPTRPAVDQNAPPMTLQPGWGNGGREGPEPFEPDGEPWEKERFNPGPEKPWDKNGPPPEAEAPEVAD